ATQQITLRLQAAIQARDFRAQLERVLAAAMRRNAYEHCRENRHGAERKKRRKQPEVPFTHGSGAQGFHGDVGVALSLDGVLEHRLQFFFRLALAELSSNSGGEFRGIEGKGNDVVRAEIQGAGSLQSASVDDHQDFERWASLWLGLELGDEPAAAQVG